MRYRAEILTVLTNVYNIVLDPKASAEIRLIQERCLEVQGRPLNVIDFEHVLCKIASQVSVMNMDAEEKAAKKAAKETKAKGKAGKKRSHDDEDNVE